MFLDATSYPVLRQLADNAAQIGTELQAALQNNAEIKNAFLTDMSMDFPSNQWAWENGINRENVGYDLRDGSFSMHAIYKKKGDETVTNKSALFPRTMAIISRLANVHYVAFSFLRPGTHIQAHSHTRSHYVYHLLLNDLQDDACEMSCGTERKFLKHRGDNLLFDYSQIHETYHRASNIRINLMVDFQSS